MGNTVIFYKDWYEAVRELQEDERLRAYDAIMLYAFEGTAPSDKFIKAVTALMRKAIDRDKGKFAEVSRKRAEAVSKRWKAYKSMQKNTNHTNDTSTTDNDNDNENVNENDNEPTTYVVVGDTKKEKTSNEVKKKVASTQVRRFVKPTVEQVRAYCQERGNYVNPEQFVSFYESKGWVVGKSPMKDWKAAVRTWEAKDGRKPVKQGVTLGAGEWIDNDGKRRYGSGHEVPMTAPARPSESSYWSTESNSWVSGV